MNPISETIPAVFSPETAFSISLHAMNEKPEPESEAVVPLRFALLPEDTFTRYGIPESALHD